MTTRDNHWTLDECAQESQQHEELRRGAKRFENYALKVRYGLWSGDRDQAIQALADVAEAAEAPGWLVNRPAQDHWPFGLPQLRSRILW